MEAVQNVENLVRTPHTFMDKLVHWLVLGSYVAAFFVLLVSLLLTFEGQLWVLQIGSVSSVSLASASVIYVLSQYRLKSAGYTEMKALVLGVLLANAFLQCFEVIYGLTFALSGALASPPSVNGAELRTFLLWLIMISPILLVHEHLRFKWTSAALLSLLVAVWVIWIFYGYPQYYYSGYAFPQFLKTSDPYHVSLWLNFGSKALLAAFFVSMLEPMRALRDALARLSRPQHP